MKKIFISILAMSSFALANNSISYNEHKLSVDPTTNKIVYTNTNDNTSFVTGCTSDPTDSIEFDFLRSNDKNEKNITNFLYARYTKVNSANSSSWAYIDCIMDVNQQSTVLSSTDYSKFTYFDLSYFNIIGKNSNNVYLYYIVWDKYPISEDKGALFFGYENKCKNDIDNFYIANIAPNQSSFINVEKGIQVQLENYSNTNPNCP